MNVSRRWFMKGSLLVPAVATIMPGWLEENGPKVSLPNITQSDFETDGRSFYPQAVKEAVLATEKIWIERGGHEFDATMRDHLMDEVAAVMMVSGRLR
jgi:hypothetical protein